MGWVKITGFNKYNAYQHLNKAEILKIRPSQFSNDIPFENPEVISSTSNLTFVREGIYLNEVTKENNDSFKLTKLITDIGFETVQGLPLFYILYNSVEHKQQSKATINISKGAEVVQLRFYLTGFFGVLHVVEGSANNKPPIEFGFKIYNNLGQTFLNISSRGQWDTFDLSPYYDSKLAKYGEEVVLETRVKTFDIWNKNTFDNQILTLEAYATNLPNNFNLADKFISWISCRVDVFRKGEHILPDINQIFIYENK